MLVDDSSNQSTHEHAHKFGNEDRDSKPLQTFTLSQILLPTVRGHESVGLLEEHFRNSAVFSTVRQRFHGWKGGLLACILADTTVLLIIFSSTLAAALAYPKVESDIILINGACSKTKIAQTWLHLILNILSTILLSTSSYAMQCLGSPTRDEVSAAHERGRYMNIGVPSISNLFLVKRRRLACYLALAATSVPIHLLANSSIYETIGVNSYIMAVADERFVTGDPKNIASYISVAPAFESTETFFDDDGKRMGNPDNVAHLGFNFTGLLKSIVPQMERLENEQCIEAYSDPFSPSRRNVIPIVAGGPTDITYAVQRDLTSSVQPWYYPDNASNPLSPVYYQSIQFCPDCRTFQSWTSPSLWTCAFLNPNPTVSTPRTCDTKQALSKANSFSINDIPISYCLSEKVEEQCRLQASIPILAVVIFCALVKTMVLCVSLRVSPKATLATIGDAIASFLDVPEVLTRECSLLSSGDVRGTRWKPGQKFPKNWNSQVLKKTWSEATSEKVWLRTVLAMLAVLVITSALFGKGIDKLKKLNGDYSTEIGSVNGAFLWQMGFGTVNANFLLPLPDMTSNKNIIGHVLLINTPQLILSIIYFAYNNFWTNLLLAREWAEYGKVRRPLRTSSPTGSQRQTYFLTIPFSFAVPLQISSTLLHWLLSQSFFLARLNVYPATPFIDQPPAIINTAGYSLIALLVFTCLWTVMFLALFLSSVLSTPFSRLNSPMPAVGSCSFAISAACHGPKTEVQPELKPLKWGVVDAMDNEDGTKHCAFSSEEVYSPEVLPKMDSLPWPSTFSKVLFA